MQKPVKIPAINPNPRGNIENANSCPASQPIMSIKIFEGVHSRRYRNWKKQIGDKKKT
jgi:hypothetical protein